MATKADIIAAIQAVADATGDSNLRISLGVPGCHVQNIIGETHPTGKAWVPEPKVWSVVIEGLAKWLDSGAWQNKVKVTAVDRVANWLSVKLVAGAGIALAVLNPGGDEQLQITAIGGGGIMLPTYRQPGEPVLGADDDQCIWVDTDDSNKTWLVFRRGVGDQVKVELS